MRILIFLIFSAFSNMSFAAQQITICSSDCSDKQNLDISDTAWRDIVTIFKRQVNNDKEERSSIGKALKCIELDIIQQSIDRVKGKGDQELVGLNFSSKDEIFNTRQAIILLLDNGFIQRHVLRSSQKRTAWLVYNESASAIQSIKTGEIYIVDPISTPFATEPQITHHKHWKNEKTIKQLPDKIADLLNYLAATENSKNDTE